MLWYVCWPEDILAIYMLGVCYGIYVGLKMF